MAKLVVNSESLVSVADAIRTKGGTSESLQFPQGFVDAVGAIESGGGGWSLEGIVTGTEPSGDIVIGAITPKQQALIRCRNITSLTLNGTIFNSGNSQPFSYLGGMNALIIKNTTGAMPAYAFAYASTCWTTKIIGTCATLSTTTFSGMGASAPNGQTVDIYVPWAEGEVANAPWGATKATIHYNTTYDENDNPIV